MPTEVKICGLSDEEGVDAALAAGADFVGFVFFRRTPRYVPPARAADLAQRARGKALITALAVDADDGLFAEIAEVVQPDLLQLHGAEIPERVEAIKALTGIPVMKAVGVSAREDLYAAARYRHADRLLIDAKPPRDATRPGGNAIRVEWAILDGFTPAQPWLLAGGLNPNNVVEALVTSGARGVDVSSGVESAPGRKDPALIHAFVRAVRDFDRSRAAPAARRTEAVAS